MVCQDLVFAQCLYFQDRWGELHDEAKLQMRHQLCATQSITNGYRRARLDALRLQAEEKQSLAIVANLKVVQAELRRRLVAEECIPQVMAISRDTIYECSITCVVRRTNRGAG